MLKHSWTETFYYLTFISILNCGIDILSVSDPDLEIRGSGGEGGGWGGLSIWSKNKWGLGPSTGSATACIGLINEFLIDFQRRGGGCTPLHGLKRVCHGTGYGF